MAYKVFISYTAKDQKIAEEIKRNLSNAFRGHIEFFFAHHDIQAGDAWKDEIISNIEESNAIISIITKNSINKPWIFIEWSAFWIASKKYYILVADDVNVTDLVSPMQERQLTYISSVDSVKGILNRLSEDSAYPRDVPFNKAEDFVISVKAAAIEQEREYSEKTYKRYKENLDLLPTNDREKEEVAQFFLYANDTDTFIKVTKRIANLHMKANLAGEAITSGHPDACFEVAKEIWSAAMLAQLIIQYIENGYEDSHHVHEIIDDIVQKDQGQLRILAIYLAEQGKEDTELFSYILNDFSNMAELRKVATFFIQNNRQGTEIFHEVIEKFTERNLAELRKVGSFFIRDKKYTDPAFEEIMKTLIWNNQREAAKLIREFKELNNELYTTYKGRLTNKAIADSLE